MRGFIDSASETVIIGRNVGMFVKSAPFEALLELTGSSMSFEVVGH